MRVHRYSPLSKTVTSQEIDCTPAQLARYEAGGVLIQNCFPNLSPAEREFIMTGYTDADWKLMFD